MGSKRAGTTGRAFLVLGLLLASADVLVTPASSAPAVPDEATTSSGPAEAGATNWRVVSAGDEHTCGIQTTGRLYCWGNNNYGQLGRGTQAPDHAFYATPVEAQPGANNWTSVSAGDEHTCGLRANGRIYCWGLNVFGELGDGTYETRLVPTLVAGGHTDWVSVSAGYDHTCGRRSNGRIYCWGDDDFGQLGDGAGETDRQVPRLVAGGIRNWVSVDTGQGLTCARRANRTAWCWGDDGYGAVGDGPGSTSRFVPRLVAGGITNWTRLAVGQYHVCGRRASGRLLCWGNDVFGQLGNGGPDSDRFSPTAVSGGVSNWTTVDAGEGHTCAGRSNGWIWCWGQGDSGQRGDGTVASESTPGLAVFGAGTWTTLSTGEDHTCAIKPSKRLFCWGEGSDHQLGNGSPSDQSRPVEVFFPS
jgi:alpha-tubulin suppressor-like RCC1 family protein